MASLSSMAVAQGAAAILDRSLFQTVASANGVHRSSSGQRQAPVLGAAWRPVTKWTPRGVYLGGILSLQSQVQKSVSSSRGVRITRCAVEVEGETAVEEPIVVEGNSIPGDSETAPDAATSQAQGDKARRGPLSRQRRRITVDMKDLQVGQSYEGKVKTIVAYGCFVDIGTFTDGLVHISELSSGFVDSVENVVSIGQTVTVWVKEVDKSRLSLSMRDRAAESEADESSRGFQEGSEEPGGERAFARGKVAGRGTRRPPREDQQATHNFKKGQGKQKVKGTVKSITKFGAFIELQAGVEGLLHTSEVADAGLPIETQVSVGQEVEVRIIRIDRNKISLSMKEMVAEMDLRGVNSDLNTGGSAASNPFVEAFRRYNLIPEPEPEPEPVVAEVETVIAEPETAAEPEVVADPETIAKSEAVAEPQALVAEPGTVAEPEAVTEPQAVVAEPETIAKPEAVAEPESVVAEPEPVAEPEAVTEPQAEVAEPEAVAELQAVVAEPETAAEPEPETVEPLPVEEVVVAESDPDVVIAEANPSVEEVAAVAEPEIEPVTVPETESVPAVSEESPAGPPVAEVATTAAEATPTETTVAEAVPEVIPVTSSVEEVAPVAEKEVSKPAEVQASATPGVTAATVKALRDETGAGMMACKKALAEAEGDLEKAKEILRKKGLASAEKKASRLASEGLVSSYIHDGRIGVLIEVNCETDFVSRGAEFKSLVEDLGMQVAACADVEVVNVEDLGADVVEKERAIEMQREDLASKPEAIRAKIVDGRIGKVLNKFALLEQPYIKNDKVLVKDLIKESVAKLGENIQVRRFQRFNLGEGLQKKSSDFAAEVAAASVVNVAPKVEAPAPVVVEEETPKVAVSAALVKELREATGAGMMDCKKALAASENNMEKATEYLRKKGLASADKKASRAASEGLIGSYIHDGRIGVMVEVNCETDFVARGEKFQELVKELAMQVAACPQVEVVSVEELDPAIAAKEREIAMGEEDLQKKPEAIRAKIVDGRMAKRLGEFALLEQPYIRNDKLLIKDLVKETIAALGENIQIRRFERFNLGEGLEKKSTDFAAEVAAAAKVS